MADGLEMDPAALPTGPSVRKTAPHSLLKALKQRPFNQFVPEKAALKTLYLPDTIEQTGQAERRALEGGGGFGDGPRGVPCRAEREEAHGGGARDGPAEEHVLHVRESLQRPSLGGRLLKGESDAPHR